MSFSRRPKYPKVEPDWVYCRIQNRLNDSQLEEIVLMDYIEEVGQTICNYINRTYVPFPLRFVYVNLVMDVLKSQALNGNIESDKLSDVSIGMLSKIEDGDSQLQFKTNSSSGNTGVHIADTEELLYNYKEQLNKYRLVKW